MKCPFQILHIEKGESVEAFKVRDEKHYLRIVSLCPVPDGWAVVSNSDIATATFAMRYTAFVEAYAEYYQRINTFLKHCGGQGA